MPVHRLIRWLAGTLCAGLGLAVGTGLIPTRPVQESDRPVDGIPYAVEIDSDGCTFDLSFDADTRYFVAVSSLGTAAQTYGVSVESEPVEVPTLQPFQRVEPLQPQLPHSGVVGNSAVPSGPVPSSERFPAIPHAGTKFDSPAISPVLISPRTFHLHVADGGLDDEKQYTTVVADLIAAGSQVRVYLDRQQAKSQLVPGVVDEILRLFEMEIIPQTSQRLGGTLDIDGDGSFAVLLTPWLDRMQGGRTSLGGFVRGSDFRTDVEAPFSNHCDMMYLNSNVRPGPHLKSLLSHEYTHAISFSERLRTPCGDEIADEEDWLNEAIAHCSENICDAGWSNIDYRISRFLTEPSRFALVIPDYYRAGLWRDHGCRGATYLFLRWCVDQFGEELLPALMRSPNNGVENLAASTGCSFEELFRHWSLSLVSPRAGVTNPRWTYHTLNPYGRLTSWGLVGPRTIPCPLGSDVKLIGLKGTSTAFLEFSSVHSGGQRVTLKCDPGARLQVTFIKAASVPTLEATAEWSAESTINASGTTPDAAFALNVTLNGIRSAADTIEMIACEWNSGSEKQSYCFSEEDLRAMARDAARRDVKDERRELRLPIPNAIHFDEELVVKVAARTKEGRRIVAWTTVPMARSATLRAGADSRESSRR